MSQLFIAEVPHYLPVILERYNKFKAGKFSFQNLKFSEYLDDSDHDSGAFDMYFICSNGIVPAHRIVIANVSKYIQGMLDDQPPWFPVKIHLPDLTADILEILVDLAYSGEMKFPEELQGNVIDAMQALGWIHTDCLSADFEFDAAESLDGEDDTKEVKYKPTKGLEEKSLQETGLNFVFPSSSTSLGFSSPKRRATFDKVSDVSNSAIILSDDDSMEISRLPDFDLSDSEDIQVPEPKKPVINDVPHTSAVNHSDDNQRGIQGIVGKINSPRTSSRKSSRSSTNTQKSNKDDQKKSKQTKTDASKRTSAKKTAPAQTKKTPVKQREHNHVTPVKRLKKGEAENSPSTIGSPLTLTKAGSSDAAENSGILAESPTKRQRRKPKRYEEFEEIPVETSRPKATPVKSSAVKKVSSTCSPDKHKIQTANQTISSRDAETTSTNREALELKTEATTSKSAQTTNVTNNVSKSSTKASRARQKRNSTESPLITSFFSKKEETSETEKAVSVSFENGPSNLETPSKASRKGVRGTKRQNEDETNTKPGCRMLRRKMTEDGIDSPSGKNDKAGLSSRRSSKAT